MSSKHVRDEVKAWLAANWDKTPIIDPDNSFETPPEDLVPWVYIKFLGAVEAQRTIGAPGSNCWREEGSVQLVVFVPSGTGDEVALQYAEDLRNMIRGLQLADIQFRAVDPPNTALPSTTDSSVGNWFGFDVTADYYYDIRA